MEQEKLIKLFIKNGFQLTKSAIPLIDEPEKIIEKLKKMKPKPFFITAEHIKKIKLSKEPKEKKIKIKINEIVECIQSYYKKISKNILKKNKLENLLSINKINENSKKFSIIGMIRWKKGNKIIVEDLTGEAALYITNDIKINKNYLNNIFGFVCEVKENKINIINLIEPDEKIHLTDKEKLFFNLIPENQ